MTIKHRYLKCFLTLFLIILTLIVEAQKTGISGRILDQVTQEVVPFASVAIFDKGFENLISGTISDAEGNFSIENTGFGDFQMVVSFIGYTPDTLTGILLTQSNLVLDFGNIPLSASVTEIEGIDVVGIAQTSRRHIDRQTYRAGDFETARGGNAADVLSRLPSLSVDPDGTVSLRGTSDFMVYLNGKPTQMDPSVLLGQIPANSIESIDVITVPTARFDAQGSGGIINITTRRTGMEGLSVVADGLAGGAPWANETHTYSGEHLNYNRLGAGISLIYQKDNFTLFGGLNHSKRNLKSSRSGDARLLQPNGSYYHMIAAGQRQEWQENYSANIGLDYHFDTQNMLSAYYYFGHRNEGRTAHYIYHNFYGDIHKNPVGGIDPDTRWLYNPNIDDRTGVFHTVNLDFLKKWDNNQELRTSLLYEHSGLRWYLDNPDYHFDAGNDRKGALERRILQTDSTPLDGVRFTMDYEKTFDNGHSLGLGIQPQYLAQSGGFTFDTLNIASNVWAEHDAFLNQIELTRGIYAGYADYSGNFSKWDFKAGMRLEYMDQTLSLENPDYLNIFQRPTQPVYEVKQLDWFPTLHVRYGLNENNALILAASRRINRPPTKNMAPFLYRRHHEVYVVGDPELKPEYLSNLELSLDKRMGKQQVTLTGFYRGTSNAIFRVNTVYEQENVLIRSFTNAGDVQALGAELNANFVAGSFARFFVGGSLYDFHVKGDIFGYRENNRSTNWSVKGNMNLFLSRSLRFTADVDLRSATVTTQGRDEMYYVSNTALTYTPARLKGWNFGLKVIDVLASNIQELYTRAYDTSGNQIFYQDTEFNRSGPIIELTASYSFNMNGRQGRKADSTFGKEQF